MEKINNKLTMKKKYLFIGCLILIAIFYSIFFVTSPEKARTITREDGSIETLSALFYLLAAVLMAILYFKTRKNREYILKGNRNIFFLLLALFFLLCFGEEISWGQRIFGIGTPERLQEINAQKELNLHNLWFFQTYDEAHSNKTGFNKWVTAVRLYDYTWILYCFFIPILNKYSLKLHNIFRKYYFPVIPIWIGVLFLTNFILSKIVKISLTDSLSILNQPITEIREINFAFLYFIAVVSLFYAYKPLENLKTIR